MDSLQTGSFKVIIRGITKDGLRLHESTLRVPSHGSASSPDWDQHCVTLTVDRPLEYVAIYFLLESVEGSSVSVANVLLDHHPISFDQMAQYAEILSTPDVHTSLPPNSQLGVPFLSAPDELSRESIQSPSRCLNQLYKSKADFLQVEQSYRKHAFFHQATRLSTDSMERPDVTIATQFTADRSESLVALHQLWRGPISAVLFVRDLSDILQIEEIRQHTPLIEEWVDFHFVYANVPSDPYPVNLLRAFAIQQVRTTYHISLDVDFLPRPGLREYLCTFLSGPIQVPSDESENGELTAGITIENGRVLDGAGNSVQLAVLVVPAFEMDGLRMSSHVPRHKKDLARFVRNAKARPLNVKLRAEAHAPSDYKRWFAASNVFEVKYQNHYEPFLLGTREMPLFDQRFQGYGFDKASQAYELYRMNARFFVLNDAFIVHMDHPVPDWRKAQSLSHFQHIWMNVYEFLYECERRYKPASRFHDMFDEHFDWLDFQDFSLLQEQVIEISSSSNLFLATPLKLALIGLMLMLLFRRILAVAAISSRNRVIEFVRKRE